MLLWFVGAVVLVVWAVFRDPGFDHRLLVVGGVVPLVDLLLGPLAGGVLVLHSLVTAVAVLGVVMVVSTGRRSLRKSALGLPIGMMVHLVVTGAWRRTTVFWWPLGGFAGDGDPHPVLQRGWWSVALELVGLVMCSWIVRRADWSDPAKRAAFRRTGRLDLERRVA